MDRHLFDQKENGGNGDDDGYAHEPKEIYYRKGQQQEKEQQRKVNIQAISCREYRILDPLALTHGIAQPGKGLVYFHLLVLVAVAMFLVRLTNM